MTGSSGRRAGQPAGSRDPGSDVLPGSAGLVGAPLGAAPAAPAVQPARATGGVRRRVGFLGHQIAEYALAAALVAAGVRVSGRATLLLIGTGIALMVLASLTDGPLGALHVIGRRVHHALDLVVIALLVLSPLVSLRHPDAVAIAIAELIALVLLRIERGTSYAPAPPRQRPAGAASAPRPSEGMSVADAAGATAWVPGVSGGASVREMPGASTAASPARPSAGGRVVASSTGSVSSTAVELASAARNSAAAASAVASHLAPVAARAAHRGAFQLGLITGVARKVNRERKALARSREASAPASGRPPAER